MTYIFSIETGNESGAFSIDPSTGEISVFDPAQLDAERTPVFSLIVKASLDEDPDVSGTGTIRIHVTKVNSPQNGMVILVDDADFSIPEDSSIGTVVGTVTARTKIKNGGSEGAGGDTVTDVDIWSPPAPPPSTTKNVAHNIPIDLSVGTDGWIIPVNGGALMKTGTASAIPGITQLTGPFSGPAPDIGAYESGLGSWTGPRRFTTRMAYGIPPKWREANESELPKYQDIGAPASVSDFRLLLVKDSPRSFIVAYHESGDTWGRYRALVGSNPLEFRDGLGSNSNYQGARVESDGVLNIKGGGEGGIRSDDWFMFLRSLWYPWDISTSKVLSPSGSFPTLGGLSGDVTFSCASINWNEPTAALAKVEYRRVGEGAWRRGLDLFRVKYSESGSSVDRLSGSLFRLAPGTTYELRLTTPKGDTVSGKFTTRGFPKNAGAVREVPTGGSITNTIKSANSGDVVVVHAGAYKGTLVIDRGVTLRAFGDGPVSLDKVEITNASGVWLDNLDIGSGGVILDGISSDVVITRSRITGADSCIDARGRFPLVVLDCVLVGNNPQPGSFAGEGILFGQSRGRGGVAAFNDISLTADGISYGHGNIDVHDNQIHHVTDDYLEPDYAWDNYRIWGNKCWAGTHHFVSHQPQKGGPWYVFRNQSTGTPQPWKCRSGAGPRVCVNNTLISTEQNQQFDDMLSPDCVLANTFWMRNSGDKHLGYGDNYDGTGMRLMDYNCYSSNKDKLFYLKKRNVSLIDLQLRGFDKNSKVVNAFV